MDFTTNIFEQFDKKWALLTAGNSEDFNTMTISWGGMGTIWNKPVVTVYVRTSRLTHKYMSENEYFTVSFYPEEMRKILGVMGSKSGRDIDKMHYDGMTAESVGESVTFAEAEVTLVCRKLFCQQLETQHIPQDIVDAMYIGDAPHDMFIGEVVDIIR